jgi:PhnB protein
MATRKSTRRGRRAARKVKSAARSVRTSARRAAVRGKVARRKVSARKSAARGAARKAAPVRRKDGRPADWPALTPYLTVSDASRSLNFYQAAFGFKVTGQVMRNDAGAVMHAGMRLGDAALMFSPQNPSNDMRPPASSGAPDSLTLYVYVPDVDALAARAERAGARVLQRPADQFWGDRIAVFRDPDGYHWTFATNVGEFDPEKAPKG